MSASSWWRRRQPEPAQALPPAEPAAVDAAAVIHQLDDGAVLCDLRGDVIVLNAAAGAMLGLAHDDPAAYRSMQARVEVQRILKGRTQGELVEMPRSRTPGAAAYVKVSVLSADAGDLARVFLVLKDAASRQRLERAGEDLFISVAERLGGSLSALRGYVRLLQGTLAPDARSRGYLDGIQAACDDLGQSIQDAVDLARLDAGRMPLSPLPVDVAALLRRAARGFEAKAGELGVSLEFKIADDRPLSIDVDEALLERAVTRLIAEALSGARRGGAVHLGVTSSGVGRADVWVSTAAPVPAPASAAAAFEKAAADAPAVVREPSRAVELCRKVARLHGGDLTMGATRWIMHLPVRQWPRNP